MGTWLSPFEHGELLAKGGGFQSQVVARHKEHTDVGDHCEGERDHHFNLSLNIVPRLLDPAWNRLILFANCILMTDRWFACCSATRAYWFSTVCAL